MNLLQTQLALRRCLTAGAGLSDLALGVNARAGLDVYQNNYRTRLIECLSETFERVRAWLGDEAFERASAVHVDRTPPSSWTLDAYALGFPETLASLYESDPEVFELAWLERALAETYVAIDSRAMTIEDLSNVDWSRACLKFTTTLIFHPMSTNAPAIWSALSADDVPPAAERFDTAQCLMVWRRELTPQFRSIDAREHDALDALMRCDQSYQDICASLVASHGEQRGVAQAAEWLCRWITDGLVTGT